MTPVATLIRAGVIEPCRPWPRHVLSPADWARMATMLADEPALVLLALWADTSQAYALLFDQAAGEPLLVSTPIEAGGYPALSPYSPVAAWFERMAHDLWGHAAIGGTDQRPWLDHGHWPQAAPMALRSGSPGGRSEPPEFLPAGDEGLDQIPLGPVRGAIEPAAHLRLTGRGDRIERLEARLGYTHKGTLTLMRGKSPRAAARFAARLSAEATVAHAVAFARATEAALGCEPPPRAVAWRGVMAELERIACHLGDLAAVAEVAGLPVPAACCARHGEAIRRAANLAFGHRLMMDCVIPGGIAADAAAGSAEAIERTLAALAPDLPDLHPAFASGHFSGGVVTEDRALRFAAGRLRSPLPLREGEGGGNNAPRFLTKGDIAARSQLRLMAIADSIRLLRTLLATIPAGAVSVPLPAESGEGIGCAAGPRGDIWHWLRLDHGQIASVFMRDPAWSHWPLLEVVAAGSQAEDLALLLASFGLASSGVDL